MAGKKKVEVDELAGRGDRALIRELFGRVRSLEDQAEALTAELDAALEAKPAKSARIAKEKS